MPFYARHNNNAVLYTSNICNTSPRKNTQKLQYYNYYYHSGGENAKRGKKGGFPRRQAPFAVRIAYFFVTRFFRRVVLFTREAEEPAFVICKSRVYRTAGELQ